MNDLITLDQELDSISDLIHSGKTADARSAAEELVTREPSNEDAHFLLAVACIVEEDFEKAEEHLICATSLFPQYVEAYQNLALVYQKKGNLAYMTRCLQQIVAIDGENGEFGHSACERLSDIEKAIQKHYHLPLDKYLKSAESFFQGFAHLESCEFDEAIACFLEALEHNPKNHTSLGNLGLAYGCLGQKEKALECFDRAIELNPDYTPAIHNRQRLLELEDGESLQANILSVHHG